MMMTDSLFLLLAEIRGDGFGQGVGALRDTENALVLFLLGLLTGVLAMTGFFIYLARREAKQRELQDETEGLLTNSVEEEWERVQEPRAKFEPEEEEKGAPEKDPWEKDPNWWKDES